VSVSVDIVYAQQHTPHSSCHLAGAARRAEFIAHLAWDGELPDRRHLGAMFRTSGCARRRPRTAVRHVT
jgi:hypothetical protein